MPREVDHIILRGGLDFVSSPLSIEPGRLWRAVNVECSEGGYRRIAGFERFDGRPAPSDAAYWMLGYVAGTGVSAVGAMIAGQDSGATANVLNVVEDPADDTTGEFVLGEVSGIFQNGECVDIGGIPLADVDGLVRKRGGANPDEDEDFLDLAAAARRDDIAKVPGSGRIRGIWSYAGDILAVRDNAAGTAGVMHRATTSGWTAVAGVTLPAGGQYRFLNHNFMGQAATRTMFGVNGEGKAFSILKAGTMDSPAWTFTSLTTNATDDKPTYIAVQNNHLLLGYRGGSLVGSGTGLPADYTAAKGAFEIACGQEINGLLGGVGLGNTLIVGEDHIQVLYGNDSTDFVLQDQSQSNTGGVANTLQSVGGPLYLDNRGVRSVTTTQAWGNWVIGTMTADVQPWLDRQRESRNIAIGSMRVRSSDQYRIWFESGLCLAIYLGRGRPELSFIDYGADADDATVRILPRCSVSAEDEDRIERVYFGSGNGFVYEAERGRSFDGQAIQSYSRLPLNHMSHPTRQKRYMAADIHCDLQARASLAVGALYEDGEGDQAGEYADVFGGGGFWDEAIFDEFSWDVPLNGYRRYDLAGIGRNVSLLLVSESAKQLPYTLNGVSLHWSPMRAER